MMPGLALGQQATQAFPRRMAFCYVPNGVLPSAWNVVGADRDFVFSKTLEPLAPFRQDILVMSGLTCDKARANGDGPGDHARAQGAFLTGRQCRKTTGEIRSGVSVDQLYAQRMGDRTRLASLEIGGEGGRQSGGCDSGYACAYSNNLSWRNESTPAPKETNPRAVFDRLFAGVNRADTSNARVRRDQYNQSILDFVLEDAHGLNNRLGVNDQRRIDEYLTSIRDIERRLGAFPAAQSQNAAGPSMARPGGVPADFRDHLRILGDLLAVAFQTDTTRVCTFVFANEGSGRQYRMIGVNEGHHETSHHQNNRTKMDKIAKINRFHVEQFAYLLGRLKSMPEGGGSVLDNSMIVYGSGNGDGNRHNHDDLPIVFAGKGGGTVDTGRHIRFARNTPICNLYLEMLDRMGLRVDSFGDSTGRLRNLA